MSRTKSSTKEHYKLAYEWLVALDEGQPHTYLAKIIGVTPDTVMDWRKKAPDWDTWGIGGERRQITQNKLAQAEELLDDGWSFAEIHRTLGISEDTLSHHFPGRGWSSEQIIDHMITMRKFHKVTGRIGI